MSKRTGFTMRTGMRASEYGGKGNNRLNKTVDDKDVI